MKVRVLMMLSDGKPNRVFRILEKWERRGWWECGVNTWHGWVTKEGQCETVQH